MLPKDRVDHYYYYYHYYHTTTATTTTTVFIAGAVKSWIQKYRAGVSFSAGTAQEFQDKFGVLAEGLIDEHNTAFKLTKALRGLNPPVYITDQVAKTWLSKFHGQKRILEPAQIEVFTTTTTTTAYYYYYYYY